MCVHMCVCVCVCVCGWGGMNAMELSFVFVAKTDKTTIERT